MQLINQGSKGDIQQWLTNAGVSESSSRKYIKKIIEYRAQSPFRSLIDVKEVLKLQSDTFAKLEKFPYQQAASLRP